MLREREREREKIDRQVQKMGGRGNESKLSKRDIWVSKGHQGSPDYSR